MSDDHTSPGTAVAGVAPSAVDVPEAGTGVARFSRQDLEPLLAELDITDSHSVLFFGSRSQERLTEVSDSLLERVRAKDAGPAGDAGRSGAACP